MDKLKEAFLPVYNSVSQVKSCTSSMLGEEVVNAEISIVIGHNGRNFVSSTDWRLTTSSGRKRIFPFTIHPQYPNFVECVAGMGYVVDSRQRFAVTPDAEGQEKAAVVIMPDGKKYDFAAGQAVKITVAPDTRFLANDCAVEFSETADKRVYKIVPDETTLYGLYDSDGTVSREW